MSNTPQLDLIISTGRVTGSTSEYFIKFEASNVSGITDTIFLVKRLDKNVAEYTYSRVATLADLQNYGSSPITDKDGYLTKVVTIKSLSLAYIKDLKDNVPTVVTDLLDSVAKGLNDLLDKTETVTLKGSSE